MPRTKKAAGTAVDRRNGRRTEIAAAEQLRKFSLPKRTPPYLLETRKAWAAMWRDPVSSLLSVADRPVLLRWADALDRAQRHLALGDEDPIVPGHANQPVESPHYSIADRALRVVQTCEAQLGVGALHRARLGLEFTSAQKSLAELNAMLDNEGSGDERDPRLG